jgi:hypothetical protein
VRMRAPAGAWVAVTAVLLVACGSGPPSRTASAPGPSATTTPVPAATAATPTPTPAPTLPAVPDFPVVAYQGDQVFGGHDGHFSAVFAAGQPVVLLSFAGL